MIPQGANLSGFRGIKFLHISKWGLIRKYTRVYMYGRKFNFHFLWRHYHPISVRILFPFSSIFDYAFPFEREKIEKILWKLRKFNQFPKRKCS